MTFSRVAVVVDERLGVYVHKAWLKIIVDQLIEGESSKESVIPLQRRVIPGRGG